MDLQDLFKPSIGEYKANRIVRLMELKGVVFNHTLSGEWGMQVINNTNAIEEILNDVGINHSLASAMIIKRMAIGLHLKGERYVINHFSKELNEIFA
jgi:hypothetical protein